MKRLGEILVRLGRRMAAVMTIVLLLTVALAGCTGLLIWITMPFLYRQTDLPRDQIYSDLGYWTGADADEQKHRLDLYVPKGSGWRVLIFVHGGGWRKGDKALKFGETDPYGNIGRFYAAHGIGVAVVNYRLQSAVTWRQQIKDIARALAWVHENAAAYGGDPRAIFLSGHSSGAQLAARAAVDHELLGAFGLSPARLCGVISVSGAPFDIEDRTTYELGTRPSLYERAFRAGEGGERWKYEASARNFITASTPPFLLMYGGWEAKGLKRQNQIMYQALVAAGVSAELVVTPWDGHSLIVGSLSHPERTASAAVLNFIRGAKCSKAANHRGFTP